MRTFHSSSTQQTIELGKKFALELLPGDIVALQGNLGSGKTHFVIGICEGLGGCVHATSPTFTMINEYEAASVKIVHIDLYRIVKREELIELGIDEYFNNECICLIEWPELMTEMFPKNHIRVMIDYGVGDNERLISIAQTVSA